jgi:hypothetical protein
MAWTTPGTAVAGAVLEASFWNSNVRDNLDYLKTEVDDITTSIRRIGFQSRTTNYTINQTVLSSATDIFTSDITWTADGSTYIVEFHGIVTTAANGYSFIALTDGGNNGIGSLAVVHFGSIAGVQTVYTRRYYTPAAGSVTINARGRFSTAGNGALVAGDGTGTNDPPAYLAVYGPVTT